MKNNFENEKIAKKWEHYIKYSENTAIRTRFMNRLLLENMGPLKGKTVLDAGCGNGFFLKELLSRKPAKLFAGDKSKILLETAKRNFPAVHFNRFDLAKKLPYRKEFFDAVLSYTVFIAMHSIRKAVKEFSRITKKNGIIHIANVHPLYSLFFHDARAKKEKIAQRLKQYLKEEPFESSLLGLRDYSRPISTYVNEFSKNGLFIEKMLEVPVPEFLKNTKKYRKRIGVPVFLYFKLKKR